MAFISSDVLRTYDIRKHTATQTKRIVMYYIRTKSPTDVQKYYNIYKLDGGKLTLNQLRKLTYK